MLKPRPAVIDPEALFELEALQKEIADLSDYGAQVERAKQRWDSAKKSLPPFVAIKTALTSMCWGHRRCMYCEDSVADEIEHVKPKSLYPERTFVWENYLYACGPCNGPKGAKFGVFDDLDRVVEIARKRTDPVVAPLQGDPVLLDPRHDDPLRFLTLDLTDTFYFAPHHSLVGREVKRAEYTIEILHLNERAELVEARATAYSTLVSVLGYAAECARSGASLIHVQRAIEKTTHRSVWEEMKRQRTSVPELNMLFAQLPVALTW